MEILNILDIIGIIVFSVSGALVAMEENLDIYGIFTLALITAVGGGVIRDVVMDRGIPVFFVSYSVLIVSSISTIITIIFRNSIHKRKNKIVILDALGLSVFAVNAGIIAMKLSYSFPAMVFVSITTGVGGGMLRDILCKRVPVVLKKEVYAVAAMIGSMFLWFTYNRIDQSLSIYISLAIIFTIRMVCIKYNVQLPTFELTTKNDE